MEAFSVLISVYYKEDANFLEKSLNSIWGNQTLKPSEVVIVKDGPLPQKLDEVITNFSKNAPVKIVKLEKNMGLGVALSEGLKCCSNELIARMDSDDISYPDRFEKQIHFMNINPDVVILGGQISEFKHEIENIVGYRKVPIDHDNIFHFAKKRSPFNHPTVIFRKTVIQKVGGYKDFRFMEDYHLWLRLLGNGHKCANLSDYILYFRMNDDVVGRRHGWFYFKQEIKLAQLAYNLKITSSFETLRNAIIRGISRLLPKGILKIIYNIIH